MTPFIKRRFEPPAEELALREFGKLPTKRRSGIALKDFEEHLWTQGIRLGQTPFAHHQAVFELIGGESTSASSAGGTVASPGDGVRALGGTLTAAAQAAREFVSALVERVKGR